MSYWNKSTGKNYQSLDNFSNKSGTNFSSQEFYELETAVVLDVVLDENHDIFKNTNLTKLDNERWLGDVKNQKPLKDDIDYTWIGRALIRLTETQKKIEKEDLIWAYPLENNIGEYPLLNEVVIAVKYFDKVYYTRKLNSKNLVHTNEDFGLENLIGGFEDKNVQKGNRELNNFKQEYRGAKSKSRLVGGPGYEGSLGRYFWLNKNIRCVKRYEGDTIIESRFGQSIRFSSYDNNRKNDVGIDDYKGNGQKNPWSNELVGGGNPTIIIRNRQRPILKEGEIKQLHKKLPVIVGTKIEKNAGGYIEEDINNDGSTIAITSGLTVSKWVTTCYKQMFEVGKEEQKSFSPDGSSVFQFPILDKDQVVINSDRLIFSSRLKETFHFSKKRYGIVTDAEFTIDAHDQIILNTNSKTVINSPAIYLGEYNVTDEPVLLGQTTVNWMYNLCNWLIKHTHWYHHSHTDAGSESPSSTQMPVELQELVNLRDSLHTLMSKRVFVTGGGLAPGKDGEKITDGIEPVRINTKTGSGVPGTYKGKNFR